MPDENYPRGSEWRKWDLHLHTPKSGGDYKNGSVTAGNIVGELEKHKIACAAITDHHVMNAVFIEDLRAESYKLQSPVVIFPAMEFRTGSGTGENIHIIGIFSNSLTKEQIAHIENELVTVLGIAGKRQSGKSENEIYVDLNNAIELIHKNNGLISIHAGKKVNGIEEITNTLEVSQAIKEDIGKKIDIFEMGKFDDFKDYRTKVFPSIGLTRPMVWASDNHNIVKYAETSNKFAWIKADPTFEGLKQIINEPDTRVFIGTEPPSLLQQKENPTRIIKQVEIHVRAGSQLATETWFENIIVPLNPELVAIIGNKGSGKSALSDIIGLVGNSAQTEHFSFLNDEKFKKDGKASHFEAQLQWAAGAPSQWCKLDSGRDSNAIEKVKYIPQLYLENICSEIATNADKNDSSFYAELEQVIFSHIPAAELLECTSLRELIGKRTAQTKQKISILIKKLWEKNKAIIVIEEKSTEDYKAILQSKCDAKRGELAAIDARVPQKKEQPQDGLMPPEMLAAAEQLKVQQESLEKISSAISAAQVQLSNSTLRYTKLEEIKSKISNFESYLSDFKEDLQADLNDFGLKFDSIVQMKPIDISDIERFMEKESSNKSKAAMSLSPDNTEGYVILQKGIQEQIKVLEAQLATPQREYQVYLAALKKWQTDRDTVSGENTKGEVIPETLKYFENELATLGKLPKEYEELKNERMLIVLGIFQEKNNLCNCLRTYCQYAQDSLRNSEIAKESGVVEFHVSIVEKGFVDGFLENINQQKNGSFHGKENGRQVLNGLLKKSDFTSPAGIQEFIKELEMLMGVKGQKISVRSQLRQNLSIDNFYKYIYSLDYLDPEYSIRSEGKSLEELSAGERGNLLLIFFLLIAKDSRPLIIDQPEDNLDNQTIYKTLVPCVNEAKKRRQIILVTHNPNLAVVCDADQVIYSHIEKNNKNRVIYNSGAIENPEMNNHILDVLEGTRPAFDARDHKYQEKSTS